MNRTPVVARTTISATEQPGRALLHTVVKATFAWGDDGATRLDDQKPLPLFDADVPTPLGLLPSDALPRFDQVFEVMLLGQAHAPRGRATPHRRVSLAVGAVRRELDVWGDRDWLDEQRFSPPRPFVTMPLSFARAFGGSQKVKVDATSMATVAARLNPHGRGFDALKQARELCLALKAPAGFPLLTEPTRPLPNLEDPLAPVRTPQDAPVPVCWAPVPMDCGVRLMEVIDTIAQGRDLPPREAIEKSYHRAHPQWRIPLPRAGAPVTMVGLGPWEQVTFPLPTVRIELDTMLGAERTVLVPRPQTLLLLPEERRFTIVYRDVTMVPFREGEERAMRLRLADGWFEHPPAQAT